MVDTDFYTLDSKRELHFQSLVVAAHEMTDPEFAVFAPVGIPLDALHTESHAAKTVL